MPEARPKIEREKIRHRRPNDLLFDDGQAPAPRQEHPTESVDRGALVDDTEYEDDVRYGDAGEDWTAEEGDVEEAVAWDHEPEDDWVLDGDEDEPEGGAVEEPYEEESGVVWEEDAYPAEHPGEDPDEMSFGSKGESHGFAPEVELAGRRDVRPKAPRPPQAHRSKEPGQPQRRPQQAEARQSRLEWDDDAEGPDTALSAPRKPAPGPRQRPMGPAEAEDKRFSRTRATLGGPAASLAGGSDEEVLEQPRPGPPQRRRQAQPAPRSPKPASASPRLDQRNAARHSRKRNKGLIAIVVLALLAGIGWFAYQSAGADGVQSMLDRISAIIPLPGSSRTAADTSFGDSQSPDAGSVSPEEAISELEQRIRQQDASGNADGQAPPAAGADGPPIPQLKPLPGATRSLTLPAPTGAEGEAQIAAGQEAAADGEQANGLSVFQQLWRYINPG